MEKYLISNISYRTIKFIYVLSIILFIFYLIFLIVSVVLIPIATSIINDIINGTIGVYAGLWFNYSFILNIICSAIYCFLLSFILFIIIFFKNAKRLKLIRIGFIIWAIGNVLITILNDSFSLFGSDMQLFSIGFSLQIISAGVLLLYFIYFFKKISGREFNSLKVKILTVLSILLLIASISFGFYILPGNNIILSFSPIFLIFIAYKSFADEGFYKNFIEAHPSVSLKKIKLSNQSI